jgi:hypothetical protein
LVSDRPDRRFEALLGFRPIWAGRSVLLGSAALALLGGRG